MLKETCTAAVDDACADNNTFRGRSKVGDLGLLQTFQGMSVKRTGVGSAGEEDGKWLAGCRVAGGAGGGEGGGRGDVCRGGGRKGGRVC